MPDLVEGDLDAELACPSEDEILACLAGEERFGDRRLPRHLERCSSCREQLAEASRILGTEVRSPLTLRTFTAGEAITDRYRIDRFVAEGGMGEIYIARDVRLEAWVAIKTVTCTTLDDGRAIERISSEARLARRVVHPNVCRVFDMGFHQRAVGRRAVESVPFLAMELLAGETLGHRIRRRGRLAPDAARPIIRGVLAGLMAIHAAGIVHRDLKSENVLLVPHPRGQRVVVMDFGLAATLDRRSSFGSKRRMMTGTPATMAPEQRTGADPAPTMDIYAFGVLLYEVVTGMRPSRTTSSEELSARLPDRITGFDGGSADDVNVSAVIGRCLAVDPAARFANVEEIHAALRGWA